MLLLLITPLWQQSLPGRAAPPSSCRRYIKQQQQQPQFEQSNRLQTLENVHLKSHATTTTPNSQLSGDTKSQHTKDANSKCIQSTRLCFAWWPQRQPVASTSQLQQCRQQGQQLGQPSKQSNMLHTYDSLQP
jgi:hypothetical protein